MCSNAGSGYGDTCDSSDRGDMLSFGSKNKQKRSRVPKRGPGVAELEKILREQEMDKVQGFCSSSMVPKCSNNSPCDSSTAKSHPFSSHPWPPPSELTPFTPTSTRMTSFPVSLGFSSYTHVPLVPAFEYLNPNLEQPYYYSTLSKSKASSESLSMDPENSLPANLSHEPYRCWPSTILPQNRHYQRPSPVMNPCLASGTQASSTLSGVRMYGHSEPPSNQTAYNYSSILTEEVGVKRPCHFSSLRSLESPHFPFPPNSQAINRPEQKSHFNYHKNIVSTNASITRDKKWDSPLELNPRNYHFPPYGYGFPTTASTSIRPIEGEMINQYKATPYHDRIEEWSNQKPEIDSVGPSHKPFYCFLQEKNHECTNEKNEDSDDKCESESNSMIDLSLRL